jgi:AraC-like DNA-binding protein
MNNLDNIVITDIEIPIVVHSKKGRKLQMTNRQSYGLSLCISGQVTYTMNGENYISDQNKAVLLPKGGTYSLQGDKEGLFPVVNFKCENFNCKEIVVVPLENSQACIKDFETLKDLFLHDKNHLKIYSAFYELLYKVSSANLRKKHPLASVIKYIAENIQSPELSNTCLAKQIGISEVYLRKLFSAHYNITPKQYVLDVRIRKAKQMLRDTPFTIATIAEACGFSSVYHFCRAFKQRTGLTPTEYAANNKVLKI